MIRHLHPTDSPALLHFKQASGPGEAYTLAHAVRGGRRSFPLVRYASIALSPRAWQTCWVETGRARIKALLRAGPRAGGQAWDISDLFLAKRNAGAAWDVLEQIAIHAARSRARRVFIRLPQGSPIFEQTRKAGYQVAYSETVFSAPSGNAVVERTGAAESGLALRPLGDADTQAMFRLYCAAMPLDQRSRVGQTIDEWLASDEKISPKSTDQGVDADDSTRLQARVRTAPLAGGWFFSVTRALDSNSGLDRLIAAGAAEAGEQPVYTVAASYERGLMDALEEFGFASAGSYDVMVKMLAARVRQPVGAVAAIGG